MIYIAVGQILHLIRKYRKSPVDLSVTQNRLADVDYVSCQCSTAPSTAFHVQDNPVI